MIDPINKLIDTVDFDAVFYSLDWHPADHVSFIDNIKQRPIHPTSPVSIPRKRVFRFRYHYGGEQRLHNKSAFVHSLHDDYCSSRVQKSIGLVSIHSMPQSVDAEEQQQEDIIGCK